MWVNMNMLQWSSPSASLTLLGIVQMGMYCILWHGPKSTAPSMYSNPKYKKCSMNNTNIPNQESQNSKKTLGKPSLPFRHSVHSLPCRSRNTESLRANWNKGLFHIRHHHRPEASTASGLVEGDLTFSHRNIVEISAISIFINVHVEC